MEEWPCLFPPPKNISRSHDMSLDSILKQAISRLLWSSVTPVAEFSDSRVQLWLKSQLLVLFKQNLDYLCMITSVSESSGQFWLPNLYFSNELFTRWKISLISFLRCSTRKRLCLKRGFTSALFYLDNWLLWWECIVKLLLKHKKFFSLFYIFECKKYLNGFYMLLY